MKWKTALTYAVPVWLVIIAAGCALALYTNFLVEVGTTEALKRLGIVAGIALPLIAWLIKKAVDDFETFRTIWGSGQDGSHRD